MTAVTVDEERGTLTSSTQQFSLKSQVDSQGREREYVEGFVATTHLDKGNDRYTEDALRMMAKDITQENDTVDAVFRDMDESQIGNVDHDNNPAMPTGDTRIVPAFKIVDAEIRDTEDGETGLWIKGMLNSDGMPSDTVSAVKNSIKDGFLNAFSIEFIPEKVRQVRENDTVVRVIEAAKAKGAALTGRPMNPEAQMTDADLKSMADEYVDEVKVDYTVQTPDYEATSEGKWEGPAKSDFPDDYDVMSIFLVRNDDSDDFSDQKLPVVDWRNDEATLVLEALRSAHELAEQVEGISDEEASRAKSKAASLAQDEFDVELGQDSKNDVSTMTDDEEVPEEEPEEKVSEGESEGKTDEELSGDEGESENEEYKSFSEDVEELKSTVQEVKEVNEDLREENDSLKSELEDLKQLQEIKSEVDEVKSLLEDVELEDGPRARQEQKDERFEDEESKADWKKAADRLGEDYLKMEGKSKSNFEAFAENHGIDTEEVKNYVNRD